MTEQLRRWPDIILLCLDAVRADHVLGGASCGKAAPFLASLASEGTLFTQCFAPAPWTLPSLGALFTGRWPCEHGADRYQRALSTAAPTLAEALGTTHETWCVSDNPYLTYRFNLTRGFDRVYYGGHYVPSFYSRRTRHAGWRRFGELAKLVFGSGGSRARLSEMAVHLASRWASRRQEDHGGARTHQIMRELFSAARDRPVFAVASYMEAHWPYRYDPAAARLSLDEATSIRDKVGSSFPFGLISRSVTLSSNERRALAALYASAVHYLDRTVRELYEALEAAGVWESAYLVVFADHGEMLGEHGLFGHTVTLHNRVLHVPLLIVPPIGQRRGRVVSKRFRLQDLREVILHLGGDGSAWREYLRQYPDEQPIYAEYAGKQDRLSEEEREQLASSPRSLTAGAALIDGQYKLIRTDRGTEYLYDLVADPNEDVNLAETESAAIETMREKLDDLQSSLRRPQGCEQMERDDALDRRLRALGYF